MTLLPEPIHRLILSLERLPGIGPKTASRLAFFLLRSPDELSKSLSEALKEIKSATALCTICFNFTNAGQEVCDICASPQRDAATICVVEDALDVLALERTGAYQGRYHVLQGVLSPIEGIGPEELKIRELIERIKDGAVKEVIIATNPSMEGDATALFIKQQLSSYPLQITRLARGLPVGGDLEYADQNTLQRALSGRQEL